MHAKTFNLEILVVSFSSMYPCSKIKQTFCWTTILEWVALWAPIAPLFYHPASSVSFPHLFFRYIMLHCIILRNNIWYNKGWLWIENPNIRFEKTETKLGFSKSFQYGFDENLGWYDPKEKMYTLKWNSIVTTKESDCMCRWMEFGLAGGASVFASVTKHLVFLQA